MTSPTLESLAEEVCRRAKWVMRNHGQKSAVNSFFSEVRVEEFELRDYLDDVTIYRFKRDGNRVMEFCTSWSAGTGRNPATGRIPDQDELQRIVNALRRFMLLEDLADV